MASPSRVNSRNAFSLSRLAGLLTCSLNSQPRATGAFQVTLVRCQTSVLIRGAGAAYPINMAGLPTTVFLGITYAYQNIRTF
jgi:hypothetical protein